MTIRWVQAKADPGLLEWAVVRYSACGDSWKCFCRSEASERKRDEAAGRRLRRSPLMKLASPATWLKITECFWTSRWHSAWIRWMISSSLGWWRRRWTFCPLLARRHRCYCWNIWWCELTWRWSACPNGLSCFYGITDWDGICHWYRENFDF